MKEQYTVDLNILWAWYRQEVGLSIAATAAVIPQIDYTQPVEIVEKPDLGLSLIHQNGITAVLPDQVLISIE